MGENVSELARGGHRPSRPRTRSSAPPRRSSHERARRLRLGAHVLSAELGYGVLGGSRGVQDRWWILASYAWRTPLDGATSLELGGGLGAGASSGYTDLDAFAAAGTLHLRSGEQIPVSRRCLPAVRAALGL